METNLVMEGFKFMALGMGTVFLFLTILIFMMNAMSSILQKYFPEPQLEKASPTPQQTDADKNKKVIAAITAAIAHHRQG